MQTPASRMMSRSQSRLLVSSTYFATYSTCRRPHMIGAHRSTPTLEPDYLGRSSSPPDDYLSTPEVSEWKETRRLEYEKEEKLAADAKSQLLHDLMQEFHEQRAAPSGYSTYPFTTIAPKDAFHDYERVRQYLDEQARSPSSSSDEELPKADAPTHDTLASEVRPSMVTIPAASPVRSVGMKAKRQEEVDEDEDDKPAPKRHMTRRPPLPELDTDIYTDDDDRNQGDDDKSGTFQPSRHTEKHQREIAGPSSRRPAKVPRRSTAPKARSKPNPKSTLKPKCNRGEVYVEGPCDCRGDDCSHCQMTCFYTFAYGERKGQVCRRLFEAGRHLDLKRHKAAHAVQEWKWLEDGKISSEEAHWHLIDFKGREHGLICPNGDCPTTFTRYDALKRHMEHGTCQWHQFESSKDGLDNRQLKAKVIEESNEKMARVKRRGIS